MGQQKFAVRSEATFGHFVTVMFNDQSILLMSEKFPKKLL